MSYRHKCCEAEFHYVGKIPRICIGGLSLQRGMVLNGFIHRQPSKHLCRRYMRSTECHSSYVSLASKPFYLQVAWLISISTTVTYRPRMNKKIYSATNKHTRRGTETSWSVPEINLIILRDGPADGHSLSRPKVVPAPGGR